MLYGFEDRIIGSLDRLLKVLTVPPHPVRPSPAETLPADRLSLENMRLSGRLMRVNHAGEVAAQGLYLGQALSTRDAVTRQHLLTAAEEENDHLAWCDARLRELDASVSVFTPFWLFGSFAIGAFVGLAGDEVSLGFVRETECQVEVHLQSYAGKLPSDDSRSLAILECMRVDEERHASEAQQSGGKPLPAFVSEVMRNMAKVMTTVAYHV